MNNYSLSKSKAIQKLCLEVPYHVEKFDIIFKFEWKKKFPLKMFVLLTLTIKICAGKSYFL